MDKTEHSNMVEHYQLLCEKCFALNIFLNEKKLVNEMWGKHVIDAAMVAIEKQQEELERLRTVEQAYEALKTAL